MSKVGYRDLSAYRTFSVAHTAQCKLKMSAKNPDRNLRFMLGHAFLLDKALYRVAEMEVMGEPNPTAAKAGKGALGGVEDDGKASGEVHVGQKGTLAGGNVAFKAESTNKPHIKWAGATTEPPPRRESTASDEEREAALAEYFEDEDADEDDEFDLTRYGSASLQPPRMVPDEGDDVDEEDEAVSPPALPADFDVAGLIEGPENEELGEMYELVRKCPCHGQKETAQKCTHFWEIPDSVLGGTPNKRLAVVQVEA